MPALNPQPDDYLLDRIKDLERQVHLLGNLKATPSIGGVFSGGEGQVFAAGLNTVDLDFYELVSPADWIANFGLNQVTFPFKGVYQVTVSVPAMTGTSQVNKVRFGGEFWEFSTAVGGDKHFTWFEDRHIPNGATTLRVELPAGSNTAALDFYVYIVRLGDIPDYVT